MSANSVKFSAGPVNYPPSLMLQAVKSSFLNAVVRLARGKNVKRKWKF